MIFRNSICNADFCFAKNGYVEVAINCYRLFLRFDKKDLDEIESLSCKKTIKNGILKTCKMVICPVSGDYICLIAFDEKEKEGVFTFRDEGQNKHDFIFSCDDFSTIAFLAKYGSEINGKKILAIRNFAENNKKGW